MKNVPIEAASQDPAMAKVATRRPPMSTKNKVRVVAESAEMQCNTTPTWCKMPGDGMVNMAYLGFTFLGFGVMVRELA